MGELRYKTLREAEAVLEGLKWSFHHYGYITVADLFTLSGIETVFIDEQHGWTSLVNFSIRRSGLRHRALCFPPSVELHPNAMPRRDSL